MYLFFFFKKKKKKKKKKDDEFTYYNRNSTSWGFNQFIKKSDLFETKNDVNKPIIENNKCVIGTYFKIYKYKQGKLLTIILKMITIIIM